VRDLHVTSPLMAGAHVLRVQERLDALGYSPGPLDGLYGVATASAVIAFQRDHGLLPDGIVGKLTRAALRRAKPPAGTAEPRRSSSEAGRKALAESLRHLGVKERPAGSNRTPFGKWFGVDGVPWCNIFVSYCFALGARRRICEGFPGAGVNAKGCAYVPTTEAWLRVTGLWIGSSTPSPGDIAIYDWDGGVADHIGIVEADLGGGTFHAIEGNTSVGNDSDGGMVMRRLRYLTQVNGFGRVT
jgi:hypothetical protein